MKYKILWYDPKLKSFAKELRSHMTFSEVMLWNELKNGKMMGYDFDRQRPVGNYILDFYCKKLMLAIEVDGITHDQDDIAENDRQRQASLERLGVKFLRFSALMVVHDIKNVVLGISNWILDWEEGKK